MDNSVLPNAQFGADEAFICFFNGTQPEATIHFDPRLLPVYVWGFRRQEQHRFPKDNQWLLATCAAYSFICCLLVGTRVSTERELPYALLSLSRQALLPLLLWQTFLPPPLPLPPAPLTPQSFALICPPFSSCCLRLPVPHCSSHRSCQSIVLNECRVVLRGF